MCQIKQIILLRPTLKAYPFVMRRLVNVLKITNIKKKKKYINVRHFENETED